MTVANFILTETEVLIVSDTCCYRDKDPVLFERKTTIRPDAGLAIISRGLLLAAQPYREISAEFPDFDHALDVAFKTIADMPETFVHTGFELTIAGWTGRPQVARFLRRPERAGMIDFLEFEPGVYLTPSLGDVDLPADLAAVQLVQIAHVQQRLSKKYGLNMCIGGDIELTTVNAGGVAVRKIGEYPDKAMMERRVGRQAPNYTLEAETMAVA